MATYLTFDELNILNGDKPLRSMPFDKYFGEMDITSEQVKERKKLSGYLLEVFEDFFVMAATRANGRFNIALETLLMVPLVNAIVKAGVPDEFVAEYSAQLAGEIVDTTNRHIEEPYFLSEDRATLLAEETANTVYNYKDFLKAKDRGFTRKKWVSMHDNRVRETHREVDGTVIGIDELFQVGNAMMRFPRDPEASAFPEETVNCRCVTHYLR